MQRKAIATWAAVLALAAGAPALAATHSHDGHEKHASTATPQHAHDAHAAPQRLALDNGRKWATDEPLRRHMGEIRAALASKSAKILDGGLTDAEALALGQAIEARVAAIVTDCKLEPEADANLHLVVADLVEAADMLQGKSRQRPGRGASKAVRATQMYATYFDHPEWVPVH